MLEQPARCVVCQGTLDELGRRESATYAACRTCHSVQMLPIPPEHELERLYREAYHSSGHTEVHAEKSHLNRRHLSWHVARRLARLRAPGETRLVAELGAGWGTLGLALREKGIPYVGLEPSLSMYAYAVGLGLEMRNGSLDVLERDPELAGRLWGIAAISVYEHLPNQLEVLKRMAALLPPDGVILIQCPTASIPRMVGRLLRKVAPRRELPSLLGTFAPPWHVCLPSVEALRLQAGRCGLVLESVEASPSGRDAGWGSWSVQVMQEAVARGGHKVLGERWPLAASHIFLLRPDV